MRRKAMLAFFTAALIGLSAAAATAAARIEKPPSTTAATATPGIMTPMTPLVPLMLPDLVVSVSGPDQAVPGQDVPLTIVVTNQGRAPAQGTTGGGTGYMVDIDLSSDSNVPVKFAVYPGYQGLTQEDFVEDMLTLGGRISNTTNLAAGANHTYTLSTHIPEKTPPGIYCIAGVVDPGLVIRESREDNNVFCHKIVIGAAQGPSVSTSVKGLWVMPFGVGGTMLNNILPNGLTNYVDSLSGITMNGAPFGGRLGFRHGYSQALPTASILYYRWLYKASGETAWHEFTEPVDVHYVKETGAVISFPVYNLGPKSVAAKNLYEFRPHNPPAVAGSSTYWPTTDWFADIYSGFLSSEALADGLHQIKLEVYSPTGVQVMPGTAFSFIKPTGTTADGTITTAPATSIDAGGYVFNLMIDNRTCAAVTDPPVVGLNTVAGPCGFLHYADTTQQVHIVFHATHPANYATFGFNIVRGTTSASSVSGEVSAPAPGGYTGDGSGNFRRDFTVTELLGSCPAGMAAYAESLHTYAKATNGWGQRLNRLDAYDLRAFALAPEVLH